MTCTHPGCSALYDSDTSRLIVRSTVLQLTPSASSLRRASSGWLCTIAGKGYVDPDAAKLPPCSFPYPYAHSNRVFVVPPHLDLVALSKSAVRAFLGGGNVKLVDILLIAQKRDVQPLVVLNELLQEALTSCG